MVIKQPEARLNEKHQKWLYSKFNVSYYVVVFHDKTKILEAFQSVPFPNEFSFAIYIKHYLQFRSLFNPL